MAASNSHQFSLHQSTPRRPRAGGQRMSQSNHSDSLVRSHPLPSPLVSSSTDDMSSGRNSEVASEGSGSKKITSDGVNVKALAKKAQIENDSMVYLDGPQVYTCGQCRTHLTSHDDIISKSFHGRHGRAYLFDQCVNVSIGPAEDRLLITGLHSVCDIFCKRCKVMVGWTYSKAYEPSQKYKEGKYIIEKINLHLEECNYYDIAHPAGERADKWRRRSMSWGSENSLGSSPSSSFFRSKSGSRDVGVTALSPSSQRPSSSYASGAMPHSPHAPRRSHNHLANMPPPSPRSPNDIVYEYRSNHS